MLDVGVADGVRVPVAVGSRVGVRVTVGVPVGAGVPRVGVSVGVVVLPLTTISTQKDWSPASPIPNRGSSPRRYTRPYCRADHRAW